MTTEHDTPALLAPLPVKEGDRLLVRFPGQERIVVVDQITPNDDGTIGLEVTAQ